MKASVYTMTGDQARLIFLTVSSLHAIASTLTGEAKSELSALIEAMARAHFIPNAESASLLKGLQKVRANLLQCQDADPVGDGNKLWDVFMAAWREIVPANEMR